jgi:hypothetical protein
MEAAMQRLIAVLKSIDKERFFRVCYRFFAVLGGVFTFAWLPAQAPLFVFVSFSGLVFVFFIMYHLDGEVRSELERAKLEREKFTAPLHDGGAQ